jgi:hypothetical protein
MSKTIQSNIDKNTKNYANFSYFLGGIDDTQQNLDQFTPYTRGVSRIFMYTMPYFMEKEFPTETENFRSLIETGYTAVSGIGDITVDFNEFEGGFNGQKFSAVSMAKDDTDTLTISVYEMMGQPVREYIDTWVTGTRDIRSGIAHYHGGISDGISYSEKYHTAEFIYMDLDPTGKGIEYACMFAHAFPTKVPKSHLDYEHGNRDNALIDLEFRVTKYESPAINQVALWYLENSSIEYNYLAFDPHITEDNVKANAHDYGSGSLSGTG